MRLASKTKDAAIYTRRVALVRWLYDHHHEHVVAGLLDKRLTWRVVEHAQTKGSTALRDLGKHAASPALESTVADFFDQYRRKKREEVRDQLYVFARWIRAQEKREPVLADFTAAAAVKFLGSLTRQDKKKSAGALAGSTLNRYRAALSMFGAWCRRAGLLDANPITEDDVPAFAEANDRMPVLRPEEVRVYLATVFDPPRIKRVDAATLPRRALVLALCLTTGADVGEVLALRPSDITWQGTPAKGRPPTGATILFKRTKTTTRERMVPLAEPTTLAQLWDALPARGNAPLFATLTRHHLWCVHEVAAAACGHPDLSIKDLRHIAGQMWRRARADLMQVKEWYGHASLMQTQRYAVFGPDEAFDSPVVRSLGALYGGASTASSGAPPEGT